MCGRAPPSQVVGYVGPDPQMMKPKVTVNSQQVAGLTEPEPGDAVPHSHS